MASPNELTPSTYRAMCPHCKKIVSFTGTVTISDTGRMFASGPCPVCGTTVTVQVYTYPTN